MNVSVGCWAAPCDFARGGEVTFPSWDFRWAAAMLSIVDAFDAMTSNRPYRGGMEPETAKSILADGAGSQWDPALVERFAEL